LKICTYCKIKKPYEYFGPHARRADGRQTYCKQCAKEKQAEWYYRRKFGIELHERDAILEQQDGCCAICRNPVHFRAGRQDNTGDAAVVDHCHTTGTIRGILCGHCNTGLGAFKDSIYNLAQAATYLLQ